MKKWRQVVARLKVRKIIEISTKFKNGNKCRYEPKLYRAPFAITKVQRLNTIGTTDTTTFIKDYIELNIQCK